MDRNGILTVTLLFLIVLDCSDASLVWNLRILVGGATKDNSSASQISQLPSPNSGGKQSNPGSVDADKTGKEKHENPQAPNNSSKVNPKGSNNENNNTASVSPPTDEKIDKMKSHEEQEKGDDKTNPQLGTNGSCDGSSETKRCRVKKLVACIQSFQSGSKDLTLVVQNEGDSTLKVNITIPNSVKNDMKKREILTPTTPVHRITTELLDGSNFLSWSRFVKLYLGSRGKLGLLNGAIKVPESTNAKYAQWKVDNYTVLGWLFNSMEPRIYRMFMYHDVVSRLWTALTKMYAHARNDSPIYQLYRDIFRATQDDLLVLDYFGYLQTRWEKLSHYKPLSNLSSDAAKLIVERIECQQTYAFLMGLRHEFEPIHPHILASHPLLPLLIDAIIRERLVAHSTQLPLATLPTPVSTSTDHARASTSIAHSVTYSSSPSIPRDLGLLPPYRELLKYSRRSKPPISRFMPLSSPDSVALAFHGLSNFSAAQTNSVEIDKCKWETLAAD
ncbi:hypothetical protein F0562_017828 [Nyssa sinensis]|uniref:Uncharacterized protein n=1 Tax=Nyssa sinensis TaxID=561372 RepID=A0A5J4ZJ62_9ASTE|nr:hypothetical protein F0562_017828 [Nyssa sinensis]